MARVVQQRSNPPYLLIVVFFLLLVTIALFVLQYMKADDLTKELAKAQKASAAFVNASQLNDDAVRKMVDEASKAGGQTVVAQLRGEVEGLIREVSQTSTTARDALDKTQGVRLEVQTQRRQENKPESWSGLVEELRLATKQAGDLAKEKEALKQKIGEAQAEIEKVQAAAASREKQLQDNIAGLNTQIAAADKKATDAREEYKKQLDEFRREAEQAQAELNKNIAQKTRQIQEMQANINRLQDQVTKLQETRKPTSIAGAAAARKPDGQVLRTSGEVCYINLGSSDRIEPGMTFSIYPQTGIPETGEGKGALVVSSVQKNVSECRISKLAKGEAVLAGDLIANLAYDPTRTYNFVVEGTFDLYGSGQPSLAGADEVKMLIKRFGGKVGEDVTVDTDFIVMGTEPPRPPRPAESAAPQVWQVWRDQMKIYDRYNAVRQQAQSLNIPILTTNSFLAFVGYAPAKTLTTH